MVTWSAHHDGRWLSLLNVHIDGSSRLQDRRRLLVFRVVMVASTPMVHILIRLVTVSRTRLGRYHAGEKFHVLTQHKRVILLLDPTDWIIDFLATKVPEKLAVVDDFASNDKTRRGGTLDVPLLSFDMLGEKMGCRTHLGEFVIATQFPASDAGV
jgi:hypothetical protein